MHTLIVSGGGNTAWRAILTLKTQLIVTKTELPASHIVPHSD